MNPNTYCEQFLMKPKNQDRHCEAGTEMIKSFCAMYLFRLGVSVDFVDWLSIDFKSKNEHILIIQNRSFEIELKFHTSELVKYARHRDIKKIEKKIIQKFNKNIYIQTVAN